MGKEMFEKGKEWTIDEFIADIEKMKMRNSSGIGVPPLEMLKQLYEQYDLSGLTMKIPNYLDQVKAELDKGKESKNPFKESLKVTNDQNRSMFGVKDGAIREATRVAMKQNDEVESER
jgi:hypothetical protein